MFTPVESQILNHLDFAIRSSSYKLDAHEQSCLNAYSRNNIGFGLLNFLIFGGLSFSMLKNFATKRPTRSLKIFDLLYAVVGSSAGIFAGMYYSSGYSGRQCLLCILENPNMHGELIKVTQQMLKAHHKRSNKLFKVVSDSRRDKGLPDLDP